MAMVIRSAKEKARAVRVFTDREEPRESFWKKFEYRKATLNDATKGPCVLAYYGIGGIGKTSLLRKLEEDLVGREEHQLYIRHDFENDKVKEPVEIMKNMVQAFVEKCSFDMSLFDMGYYQYKKLCYNEAVKPEMDSYIEKSRLLSYVVDVTGDIPGVDIVSKLFAAIDKGQAIIRTSLRNNKKIFADILSVTDEKEMLRKLPDLLAIDLEENLSDKDKPLVVFLDTYESLVNEAASLGDPLASDEWLRNEIIPYVPNTLWVIAGREKLKWKERAGSSDWCDADEQNLEQHCLGALAPTDANRFLYESGIDDELLRSQIYKLTNGVPLYLDICVDTYESLRGRGQIPVIDDFGKDTESMINRYIRYLDADKQQMAYIMACLKRWDREMFGCVVLALNYNINELTYKALVNMSFVCHEGSYCSIHSVVGDILVANCDQYLFSNTLRQAIEYCREKLRHCSVRSEDYGYYFGWIIKYALWYFKEDNDLHEFYRDVLSGLLNQLCSVGRFVLAESLFVHFIERADKDKAGILYADMLSGLLDIDGFAGRFDDILEKAQQAYNFYQELCSDDHCQIVRAGENIVKAYMRCGNYQQALNVCEALYRMTLDLSDLDQERIDAVLHLLSKCYNDMSMLQESLDIQMKLLERYREMYGEDDYRTIDIMSSIAMNCTELGKNDIALQYNLIVLEKRMQSQIEDSSTLLAMHSVAQNYHNLGDYDNSMRYYEEALEICRRTYGEEHVMCSDFIEGVANVCSAVGDYSEALSYYGAAYDLRKKHLPADHPLLINIETYIADLNVKLGRPEVSLEKYIQLYDRFVTAYGEKHLYTLSILLKTSDALFALNNYEDSLKLALKSEKEHTEYFGEEHFQSIMATERVSNCYRQLGDYEKALEKGTQCYELKCRTQGSDHPNTLYYLDGLADLCIQMGMYDTAADMLTTCLNGYNVVFPSHDPIILNALLRVGDLYAALGEYERSLNIYNELLERQKLVCSEEDECVIETMEKIRLVQDALVDLK